MSHPMWVRGLKHKAYFETYYPKRSHPMWVRGLKHYDTQQSAQTDVAPYVGAWIETAEDTKGTK